VLEATVEGVKVVFEKAAVKMMDVKSDALRIATGATVRIECVRAMQRNLDERQ
jgi:hypothetical protein